MKTVTADLNRKKLDNTVPVSLRRFDVRPSIGDTYLVLDGLDKFIGRVVCLGEVNACIKIY